MEAKELAKLVRVAADIHEASYASDGKYGSYTKDWHQCCEEASIPRDWHTLVHLALATGYCELWDWCDEVDPR